MTNRGKAQSGMVIGLTLTGVAGLLVGQTPNPAPHPTAPPAMRPTAGATTGASARPAKPPRKADASVTPTLKDLNRHNEFLARTKLGPVDLLFLGDSITDSWSRRGEYYWLQYAPYRPANFGVSADKTEHLLWRIEHGELDGIAPKVVVIWIGTNNIGNEPIDTPEQAAAGVTEVVRVVHAKLPAAKVLLLGVFPRGTKDSRQRADVARINAIISKLDDGARTRYLDIGPVFLDANGDLPPDVMPDRLHPSIKGYGLWHDAMRPLLDEMMK